MKTYIFILTLLLISIYLAINIDPRFWIATSVLISSTFMLFIWTLFFGYSQYKIPNGIQVVDLISKENGTQLVLSNGVIHFFTSKNITVNGNIITVS